MESQIERLPKSRVRVRVRVEESNLLEEMEKVLNDLQKVAVVPGFRKGRVPRRLLQQRLGKGELRARAIEERVESALSEVAEQNNLKVVSTPQVEIQSGQSEGDLSFVAEFDVWPTVDAAEEYKNLRIEIPSIEVGEEQLAEVLELFKNANAPLRAVERPAQDKDFALIRATFKRAGSEEAVSVPDLVLGVGEQMQLTREFLGRKVGEAATISLEEQDTSASEQSEGAGTSTRVEVQVLLKEVLSPSDPDAEWLQERTGFSSEEEFRNAVARVLKEERINLARAAALQKALDALLEKYDFEVPSSLVGRIAYSDLARIAQAARRAGLSLRSVLGGEEEAVREAIDKRVQDAEYQARVGILIEAIAEKEGLADAQNGEGSESVLNRVLRRVLEYAEIVDEKGSSVDREALFEDSTRAEG